MHNRATASLFHRFRGGLRKKELPLRMVSKELRLAKQ
jgi:hypothetical protein